MACVTTVTGRIETQALGHCQMHEHIFVRATPASARNPALCIDDEALSAAELKDYASLGGNAIVDCQPGGAGRDIAALRRISETSGVAVIASTGYHLPAFYESDHWIFTEDLSALRNRFLSELEDGVAIPGGKRVFPGVVKAAIGRDGPTGRFVTCLRAAAGAAAQAGVPLILHTEYGTGSVKAVALCEAEGLDPARIAVCHADRQASDLAIHEAIAHTGAYLEYDTIARYKYHDDVSEVALIQHMLELGYGHRLLLSLDTTAARLHRYGGAPGMGYILQEFIPMLLQNGVSKAEIHTVTEQNPHRIFE